MPVISKHPKPGYLGPAFHEWLEYLEYCECVMLTNKRPPKQKWMALNDTLFHCDTDKQFRKMMDESGPVDAWLANCVRSSVKYKVTADTLGLMVRQYKSELKYIRNTREIHLPHEWCTLIVEGFGKDTYMICLQETTTKTGKSYPELGVEAGETWISANICFYRPSGVEVNDSDAFTFGSPRTPGTIHPEQRLSYCPVEIHMTKGDTWANTRTLHAQAEGVEVTTKGKMTIDVCKGLIMAWLESFHLAAVLHHKTAGVKPMPHNYRPKKPRKRRQFPRFEHIVVELPVDAPEPHQTGRSTYQPRKRLHQVRGFWRTYKTGKEVWVRPHWRGDEHLGVIRKDFEVTLHDEHTCH